MALFCSWLFCAKKCGRGVRTILHFYVSGVIKGIRKRGEFKISLFNSRGGKILNSTTSGREQMGRGGREKKGCVKCGVC